MSVCEHASENSPHVWVSWCSLGTVPPCGRSSGGYSPCVVCGLCREQPRIEYHLGAPWGTVPHVGMWVLLGEPVPPCQALLGGTAPGCVRGYGTLNKCGPPCGCSLGNGPVCGYVVSWGQSPCGCSLGTVPMWVLLGEQSPHVDAPWGTAPMGMWVYYRQSPMLGCPLGEQSPCGVWGAPWGTALHVNKSCMGSVPWSHPHVSPAGRPLQGTVQAGSSAARERARAVGAGAGRVQDLGLRPGAVPCLRPEGIRGPMSPKPARERGGAEQPAEWTPLSPVGPGQAGGAVPGASGPLEPSPELQPQATSVHTSLGQGSTRRTVGPGGSACVRVGGHTQPLIPRVEGQGGSVHKRRRSPGPSSHLV